MKIHTCECGNQYSLGIHDAGSDQEYLRVCDSCLEKKMNKAAGRAPILYDPTPANAGPVWAWHAAPEWERQCRWQSPWKEAEDAEKIRAFFSDPDPIIPDQDMLVTIENNNQ